MKTNYFHTSFKLNDVSFSSIDELLDFSKEINNSVFTFLSDWFNENDFVIVQTSGSTGKPKSIRLKKEFMKNSAQATGEFFNLQENTTALLCLSTDYIAGKMMLVRALTLGWQIDVVASASEVKIEKEYKFSAMIPMQVQNSLPYLHKVEKLIVGGGVVSKDLEEKLQDIPTEVFATYGMTETISHIAVKKLNKLNTLNNCFYKILPNITIYIDERNCLAIDAPKVSDEFIITNDVVQLVSENQFEWLGRFDNVINSGGIKLHPEKIEEKLSKIIKERFFVVGIPDENLGEKMVLVIEGEKQEPLLNLISSAGVISKYQIPKEVYYLNNFLETETKKILRTETLRKVLF